MNTKKARSPSPSQASPVAPLLLVALSVATALLAVYQWMELVLIRNGGEAVCAIGETINCTAVWNSPFASAVHRLAGMPVAGLGLVWALAAFGTSLLLVGRLMAGRDVGAAVFANRVVAAVGLVACLGWAAASLAASALCLTCLGTYALVGGFAFTAFRLLPGPFVPASPADRQRGLVTAGAAAGLCFLALLGPGLATPKQPPGAAELIGRLTNAPNVTAGTQTSAPAGTQPAPSGAETGMDGELRTFLLKLPDREKQAVANALYFYRASQPVPAHPPRLLHGPADAPVKVVEWLDIRCGHCRTLNETMKELRRVLPADLFSVEPRNYPLDGACNPDISGVDATGARCTAAKALICLEGNRGFDKVRDLLFEEQASLTGPRVLELSSQAMPRAQLEKCIGSEQTTRKLMDDITYARKFDIEGTPLVVVNGRRGSASPAFLFAMAVTGGNPEVAAFDVLPPPNLADPHAGHGH